ncbi:hypothetical protein [Bradyrhizobium guangdongense]|uniref:hypothetical protein n=1 Tax=Bradyrhizobium guangdongense TaxID=1325090 RepID=UPI0011282740|nr:hypothetical protein [Bradyrhizobium guangdongense]
MRTILALGLLVALTATVSAAPVHHKRHAAPAAQTFAPQLTPRAAEGYAYVPYSTPYSAPANYGNPYQNWGG